MTLEDLFRLRKRMPELSGDAILLIALIEFRMQITEHKDRTGKFVYLTGMNDPKVVLGFNRSKFDRVKKELKDANLIVIKRQGNGEPGKVYLTLEKYEQKPRNRSLTSEASLLKHEKPQKRGTRNLTSEASFLYKENTKENSKESNNIYPRPKINFFDYLKPEDLDDDQNASC